jgi:hypothetical protein
MNGLKVTILTLTLIQSTQSIDLLIIGSPLFLTIEQGPLKYCHFSNLEKLIFMVVASLVSFVRMHNRHGLGPFLSGTQGVWTELL